MYERNRFSGYDVQVPLHMSDFTGMGKYAGLYPEFKRALFSDVARLINEHKVYSISIGISQREFDTELSAEVRRALIGPYALAFFSAVALNQAVSERIQYEGKVDYLVDDGFAHMDQLKEAHSVIVNIERQSGRPQTGALTFRSDDGVPMLQAADAIAWAARRRQLDGALGEGFDPLNDALVEDRKPGHAHVRIPPHGIKMVADPINAWINRRGIVPSLADVIRR
jgi:hypothetical protein